MSTNFRHKIIMDPVHGDIGLSELETKIINTPTFQRLRRLKQLGFASFVYPNASYSRFAHSIGVLYLAGRVAEIFLHKDKINEEAKIKLRLAAVLHDVGHYPYSHLMEYISREQVYDQYLKETSNNLKGSDARFFPSHEKVGRLVVTKRKDIAHILAQNSIDPEEISALIEGGHTEIPNILNKSLDVDRLDYLVRDSYNAGLPYGRVDVNYILNSLDIINNNEVVLKSKARLSAEHLLLARYFMFNAVYSHKTIFGFEELVRNIIAHLIKEGKIEYTSKEDIEKMVQEDSGKFLKFHDGYLDHLIEKLAATNSNEPLTQLCTAIQHRQPPKLVHEEIDLQPGSHDSQKPQFTNFRKFLQHQLKPCLKELGISEYYVFWREPKDIHFEATNPFINLSRFQSVKDKNEIGELGKLGELVNLLEKDGTVKNLVDEQTSIIYHLSQFNYKSIRLYAVNLDDVKLTRLRNKIENYISS